MKRLALLLSFALAASPLRAAGTGDPYEDLAAKLSTQAARKLVEKKIAILPFEYVDGRASTGGRAVAEKLTNRFVELGEFTVIERSLVEKVIKELEFQNTGTVDPEKAKSLGKGLGVEAIVTGTLSDAPYNNVEVNARVIKAESYEIVAAGVMKVKKTWSDAPAPTAEAEPAYSSPVSARRSSGPGRVHGFVDIMFGISNATMDLEFEDNTGLINQSELNFVGINPNPFRSISFTSLETKGSTPFIVRVGAFGQIFGGDVQMGTYSHGVSAQSTTHSVNGINRGSFRFTSDPYLKVSILDFSGDLYVRFPTGEKIYPYLGMGMGLSLNTITSSFARMGPSATSNLNETVPGFLFRIPFGMRVNLNDRVGIFGEGRFWMNTFAFDRGIASETSSITLKGFQFLTGIGLLF